MFKRLLTRYGILLPLLVLAVAVIDRIESPDDFEAEETIDMHETRADYYMSEFRSRRFAADGSIEYIVEGSELFHYPDDDRSVIFSPRVELHRNGITWLLDSNQGRFDPEPELFTLQGDVRIRRLSTTEQPVIINTSQVLVQLRDNVVKTNERIEVEAPTWRVEARGLHSSIDDGQLHLLSDVHGEYQWPSPQND